MTQSLVYVGVKIWTNPIFGERMNRKWVLDRVRKSNGVANRIIQRSHHRRRILVIDLWPRKDIRSSKMRWCYSTEPDDSRARPNSIHSEFKLRLESLPPLSSRISRISLSLSLSFSSSLFLFFLVCFIRAPSYGENFITVRVSAEMYPRPRRRCTRTYNSWSFSRHMHPCARCTALTMRLAPFTGESYRPRSLEGRIFRGTGEVEREDKSMLEWVRCICGVDFEWIAADLSNGVNWNLF